jgi:hypothetical protein
VNGVGWLVLGPRTDTVTVCLLAPYFSGTKALARLSRGRGQRGADVGEDAAVEGQPAGFTLRSSSRSALAEEETMLVPRMVSCSVAQAMHL